MINIAEVHDCFLYVRMVQAEDHLDFCEPATHMLTEEEVGGRVLGLRKPAGLPHNYADRHRRHPIGTPKEPPTAPWSVGLWVLSRKARRRCWWWLVS
jgi:hypothetical protein